MPILAPLYLLLFLTPFAQTGQDRCAAALVFQPLPDFLAPSIKGANRRGHKTRFTLFPLGRHAINKEAKQAVDSGPAIRRQRPVCLRSLLPAGKA